MYAQSVQKASRLITMSSQLMASQERLMWRVRKWVYLSSQLYNRLMSRIIQLIGWTSRLIIVPSVLDLIVV